VPVLGAIWFALFLAPSMLVPLLEHMAEHRVYESSGGLFLAVGFGLSRLRRLSAPSPGAPLVAMGVMLLILLIGTVKRNEVWSSSVSLWEDAAQKAPDVWLGHYALADAYNKDARDCEHAEQEYRLAIAIRPGEPHAHLGLGTCLAAHNALDAAYQEFQLALRYRNGIGGRFLVSILKDTGMLEARRNHSDQAKALFEQVLALEPKNLQTRFFMALLYKTNYHDAAEALRWCHEIQSMDANAPEVANCLRMATAPGSASGGQQPLKSTAQAP
jgi:Tfp pilus assembly protein PilF